MSSVAVEILLSMCHANTTTNCLQSRMVLQGSQHDGDKSSPHQRKEPLPFGQPHAGHLQPSLILYKNESLMLKTAHYTWDS